LCIIQDYTFKNRLTKGQGGLAVLVKDSFRLLISFRLLANLEGSHEEMLFEVMMTEIILGKKI